MQSSLIFMLPAMLSAIDGFNFLLNGYLMIVLAGLGEAIALLVATTLLFSTRTQSTVSWKVLEIGVCLIAGAVILILLVVGYSSLASHSGIMLAAPDGSPTIVIAQASRP